MQPCVLVFEHIESTRSARWLGEFMYASGDAGYVGCTSTDFETLA